MDKLNYLIKELLSERKEYENISIPKDANAKKRLYRGLVNERLPGAISDEYIIIQDEYLQEELSEKPLVEANNIPTVNEQFIENSIKNGDRICLWQGDIVTLKIDAIVNAANNRLLGCMLANHMCIDNVIHTAAGLQLREECNEIIERQGHFEKTGSAKITKGYNLPCKYVVHTVGPIINDEVSKTDAELLKSCYLSSLKLAEENEAKSIAFCSISTGEFMFPNRLAAEIALKTIDEYLNDSNIEKVVIDVFKDIDFEIYKELIQKR
ncbi:MAG: protein-ADP-ribose hydrolase [Tissierellia bacterium]|nr:protein-ADP-ribose hydrolase [Tissierellia bacterium]